MTHHAIKVEAPYFDAVLDGSKMFEVRKNDRGYQAGDTLELVEFTRGKCFADHPIASVICPALGRRMPFAITYVYSGDPRFGGIEPGYVVLGLGTPTYDGGAS